MTTDATTALTALRAARSSLLAALQSDLRATATAGSNYNKVQIPGRSRLLARRQRSAVIIGCGTGRSGTLTLAKLLNGCRGVRCTHEGRPLLPWTQDPQVYEQRLTQLISGRNDVAFSWLPYIPSLLTDVPDIRIIVTRRDAHEAARSFEAWMDGGSGPGRHHWLDHNGEGWVPDPVWDPCFPKLAIADRYQAIVTYCKEYDAAIDELTAAHPRNFLIVSTAELSWRHRQDDIFAFAGIPERARRYSPKIYHRGK
jgi:hypothetical protein